MKFGLLAIAILCLMRPAMAMEQVDVELVIAVDVSRSMDLDELNLQREGYASALEHPAVTSAFESGPIGEVAFLYMEWGGVDHHRILVPWTHIRTAEDAARVATLLRSKPVGGLRGTSISSALLKSAELIEGNDFDGTRRVIDVSGDGPNNRGGPVLEARDAVAAKGIEINGLPFMVKRPGGYYSIEDLDYYYEDCVIAGESAFVIPIHDITRLIVSIRQKLVLEIAGLQPAPRFRVRNAARPGCMIGEQLRQQREWDN